MFRLVGVLTFLHFGVFSPQPTFATELPADTAEARKLLKQLGTRFSAEYSPHFTMISDADPARVADLRVLAESTCEAVEEFARRFRLPARRPASKMTVLYFNTWDDYERYADRTGFPASQWVPGFFDHHTAHCIMFNYADAALIRRKREEIARARSELQPQTPDDLEPVQPPEDAAVRLDAIEKLTTQLNELERQINTTVFRHELAHQVLHHIGLQPPELSRRRWFSEGLAMQFEASDGINHHRLADFLAIDWAASGLSFQKIVTQPRTVGAGSEHSPAAYAAAWALVHYLASEQPEAFRKYFIESLRADPSDGPSADAELRLFESFFGPLDSAFEKQVRDHLKTQAAKMVP